MEDELKDKKNSDKKTIGLIVTSILAPGLFIFVIVAIAIVISFNSMISPLEKASDVIKLESGSIFTDAGSAEKLFEAMKDFASIKGNYKNNNAMDASEYQLYEEVYNISKYYTCGIDKEHAISLVMSTLFYDGNIDAAMDPNEQKPSDDENDYIFSEESEDEEIGATREIKKIYRQACKGYEEYQQYLVDKYIPQYYPDLKTIKDKNTRNTMIGKISEEIIFNADNYIRMTSDDYIVDYNDYKIKIPIPIFGFSEDGTINIQDFDYIPVYKTGQHNGIGWKQGSSTAWSGLEIVTGESNSTMSNIGCYVTSIATVMAYSGTKITAEYFDPGVLVLWLKTHGAFNNEGALNYYNWQGLAPNFRYSEYVYVQGLDINEIIKKIKLYDNSYSIVIELDYITNKHFVAVVGYDSNGNVKISDPAKGYDNTIVNDYAGNIVSLRIFKNR